MSLFASATRPLQRLDGPVNRLSDLGVRATPWLWWPASPPRRDRPYGAGQHAAYLAWSAIGFVVGEGLVARLPENQRSTGRRLRNERIITGVLTGVVWLVSVGAWNRRAERLRRRPWQRRQR